MSIPPRILIVDNESDLCTMLSIMFRQRGYRADAVADSRKALAEIEANRPDLLILDLLMPGVSGLDVLEAMASDPSMASIPVILLTGFEQDRISLDHIHQQMHVEFLAKPFALKTLLEKANQCLAIGQNQMSETQSRHL